MLKNPQIFFVVAVLGLAWAGVAFVTTLVAAWRDFPPF
jgi:hypothetical protein